MAKKVKGKAKFSSQIGLIAATVGSAVGLGNVWRFPAETQGNGGAAFLIIYVLCVLILGIPGMLAEFSIGRAGGSDAVGSLKNLGASRKWQSVGAVSILATFLIMSFYSVVAGWTVEYLWQSVTGDLYAGVGGDAKAVFAGRMNDYITTTWKPLIATLAMIGVTTCVLLGGVQKGIERLSNTMMPVMFLLLVVLLVRCLTLPGAGAGVKYFLEPDWSMVTSKTVLSALGQAFFSLSLGMGILVTYSSYFPKETKLGTTAVTVSLLDMTVAIMMGLIIFPAITAFGLQGEEIAGATLVFVTLPEVFMNMPGTWFWSVGFFLLLGVAALTSLISGGEVAVAFMHDRLGMTRRKAVFAVMIPLGVMSAVCSLSQGPWAGVTIIGKNIFDFLDTLSTNIMLPLVSIALCVWVGWFGPKKLLAEQLSNYERLNGSLEKPVKFIIRFLAPVLIAIVFICGLL